MVLVDTSAWIEWLTDSPLADRVAPHLQQLSELAVPTLVQYELFKWATRERDEAVALDVVGLSAQGVVIPLDTNLAIAAADASARFKLAMADAIIYATAGSIEATLVTCDAHFEKLPGVEYIAKGRGRAGQTTPRSGD